MKTAASKISKLYGKSSAMTSKTAKTNKVTTAKGAFKHEFRVLTAEDVNSSRSSAYKYLALNY